MYLSHREKGGEEKNNNKGNERKERKKERERKKICIYIYMRVSRRTAFDLGAEAERRGRVEAPGGVERSPTRRTPTYQGAGELFGEKEKHGN